MHFQNLEGCMYYMLVFFKNNEVPSTFSLNSTQPPDNPTATKVPDQALESFHASQSSIKEESSASSDSSVADPLYDFPSDSEDGDSAILLNDNDSTASSNEPAHEEPDLNDKSFLIKDIMGKGSGIVATRSIKRGERILVEKPLIRHNRSFDDLDIIRTYERLTKEERAQISGLCNVRPAETHPIIGIIWTNSISLNQLESGLFITASRINHACAPNACHSWNSDLATMAVHATTDIREGEEITDSYLKGVGRQAVRKEVLARDFGFDCDCHRCMLVGVEQSLSDECVQRIWILEQKLESALAVEKLVGSGYLDMSLMTDARELLSLYEKEGVSDARLADPYVYAWRLAICNHLGRCVVESSKRVWEIHTTVKGDDHPEARFWRQQHEACRQHMGRSEIPYLETSLSRDEHRDEWLSWEE